MEIYFKLKFRLGEENASEKIETILKEMAERAHEFPNGHWPHKLRCGAEIGWFRNPVESMGIEEVLEYYSIQNDRKTAYVYGRNIGKQTLYIALRRALKYQLKRYSYDDKKFLKSIRKCLGLLIKMVDKMIITSKARKWEDL